jgi:hypothetical protein
LGIHGNTRRTRTVSSLLTNYKAGVRANILLLHRHRRLGKLNLGRSLLLHLRVQLLLLLQTRRLLRLRLRWLMHLLLLSLQVLHLLLLRH